MASGRVPDDIAGCIMKRVAAELGKVLHVKGREEVGVGFVTASAIARLNKAYRGRRGPTDVLSFCATDSGRTVPGSRRRGEPLDRGDILLCPAYAKREAATRGVPYREELIRLLVHGTLHLFGFDHERVKDERIMFRIQEDVVARVIKTAFHSF